LDAEGATIDLRGSYLDELEQLLVEPCPAGKLGKPGHRVIDVGRDLLELAIFLAGV
jgi:hypothetical protein